MIGEIGGHFGANLGTCELAVALHSLLDSPARQDPLGRRPPGLPAQGADRPRASVLDTIRQYGGLAPFCSVFESEHDIMGAGHASTSIGYAVGLKEAMRKGIGTDGKVVAVIGDGALTGGVAYEALHNAGGLETPIVIVLNDNGMSISPNVGALPRYFSASASTRALLPRPRGGRGAADPAAARPGGDGSSGSAPSSSRRSRPTAAPGLLFEELDLAYVGVIDGHDVGALRRAIGEALRRRAAGRRPHPHRQGQGLRPGRGGRPRGDGEVARREAGIDRQRAGRAADGPKPVPVKESDSPERSRLEKLERRRLRRRRSTRRCSPTRWSPRRSATAG